VRDDSVLSASLSYNAGIFLASGMISNGLIMNMIPITTEFMKYAAPIISPKANMVLPVLKDVYVDMMSGEPLANARSVNPDIFSGIFKWLVMALRLGTSALPATSPMDPNSTSSRNTSSGIPSQCLVLSAFAIQ
jgi:hypothetical protein